MGRGFEPFCEPGFGGVRLAQDQRPDRQSASNQAGSYSAIRAGKIDAGTSLRSYLFTIGQNLVADHWRRRFRVVSRSGEPPSEEEGGLEGVADVRSESPEQATSRRGLERRVREAMRALPDHYRSAFRMAAIEQRSYREIGECLGWTLDQVRINVHRARKRLIAELGGVVAEINS